MARAVLEIAADTSGIEAAFGRIRTDAQRLEQQLRATFQITGRSAATVYRDSARVQAQEARRGAQSAEREAQRAVLAFVRGEEQKRRAARLTQANQERAERQATELARAEAAKRGLTSEQEARVRTSALQRFTRELEREERRQTQIVQREERNRVRVGRDIGFGLRRGLNVGGDAAMNVARTAHSQIQDARRQRAESEHTLNAAFFQAGIAGPQAAQMRETLQRELSTGSLRGLPMEDVSRGIMGAQTQFSVLTGSTDSARQEAFNRQIQLAAFARNTFQDPAEVMRVAGMLSQQGIRGADQMSVIQSLTGMAQAGSIELSTLTSTAMGPLMQNIARVTSAQQTPAQRAAAVRGAVSQTMAVGEIGAAAGLTPRDTLNALAKMRTSVENPMVAERLDARLRAAGREGLASQMVTRDAQGRARLATRDPVQFMSQLVTGMGGDANATANLLSAGGRNAAMVLDSQQRRLILGMASQTESGQTIAQRVAGMEAAGARFGEADIARGDAIVETEQRTAMQQAEERRLTAMTDETNAFVRWSNHLDDWVRTHPITAAAWQSAMGIVGGVVGGALVQRVGVALGATRAVQALTGLGSTAAEVAQGAATVARPANPVGLLATLLSFGGAISGSDYEQSQRRSLEGFVAGAAPGQQALTRRAGESLLQQGQPITAESIGRAVAQALRENPPTAMVSPTDAAHAATQGAPQGVRR